jgi:hypothetical protein
MAKKRSCMDYSSFVAADSGFALESGKLCLEADPASSSARRSAGADEPSDTPSPRPRPGAGLFPCGPSGATVASGRRSALPVRARGPQGEAKAQVVVCARLAALRLRKAARSPLGSDEPGAAAHDARGIDGRIAKFRPADSPARTVVRPHSVRTPFPYVAVHLVQTPGVRREGFHRHRLLPVFAGRAIGVSLFGCRHSSPAPGMNPSPQLKAVSARRHGTRIPIPLRSEGPPLPPAATSPTFLQKFLHVVPAHLLHRVLRIILELGSGCSPSPPPTPPG